MRSYRTALFAAVMAPAAGGASVQCLQGTVTSVIPPPGVSNVSGNKSGTNSRVRADAGAHEDYSGAWLDDSSVRVKRRDHQSVGRRSEQR